MTNPLVQTDTINPDAGFVTAVHDDILTMTIPPSGLRKNEVVYVRPAHPLRDGERLKSEVLRLWEKRADIQVFEDTRGVAIGDVVERSDALLSATLGPGLLGQVYDGLQNPLADLSREFGVFLPRGIDLFPLDQERKWAFSASVRRGDRLRAGDSIGTVPEGRFKHHIMVPFDTFGVVEITWIQEGHFTVNTPVARLIDDKNREFEVCLHQNWPVRQPIPAHLLRSGICERLYPQTPLNTTIRIIDTFFPIAIGGTACIPGPFGAGKTVLQNLISRYSDVDICVIVACGERAGEIVETITTFPKMKDPHTGGSLMDRTIIICNTSSMPVAAREASIHTGVTIGEYYRQMGYKILLLADSTSRWAQAMRETSGRLEEIPGEEAFPAYLDSSIRGIYERAGIIHKFSGKTGSLTMIGTVSPAGGNFEEPVTQSTLGVVKSFLGLSAERAYRRFYPAIDPLISWSRYRQQLADWYERNTHRGWNLHVEEMLALLQKGDDVWQMMQVTGEEGVMLDDFIVYHKAQLLDMVYLQQDAFDEVDVSVPLERQNRMFESLYRLIGRNMRFDNKAQVREFFTRLTGLWKNLNYSSERSPEFERYLQQIEQLEQSIPDHEHKGPLNKSG